MSNLSPSELDSMIEAALYGIEPEAAAKPTSYEFPKHERPHLKDELQSDSFGYLKTWVVRAALDDAA